MPMRSEQSCSGLEQLATQPIRTMPNTTHYEWAGTTLQRLLGTPRRVAETWAFFSGPQKPAVIANASGARASRASVTMLEFATRAPEVLGPAGGDPAHHHQKYFFVKFLDPSDFPPFAYVGFNPTAVRALHKTSRALKASFRELLWQDRQALETLASLVRPRLRRRRDFKRFKAAYKRWAIEQATRDWAANVSVDLDAFVVSSQRALAQACLERQRDIRCRIVGLMHRIDFEDGQAILIETPTLHAIAGLSLQIHPKAPGNFHPKDELWIYERVRLPDGTTGWILVEPQRTFDRTESGADFFTPFAWEGTEQRGRLGFRKPIGPRDLDRFVELMDATPRPRSHYVRQAAPMTLTGALTSGAARWHRIVEESGWPYFLVRQLRFSGAGASTMPLAHHCFIELHVTRGAVDVTLSTAAKRAQRLTVTPSRPVFLPASLPYDTITYRARSAARVYFFSRPAA